MTYLKKHFCSLLQPPLSKHLLAFCCMRTYNVFSKSSCSSLSFFFKSIIISLGSFSNFFSSSSCFDFCAFLFLSSPMKFFLCFFLSAFQYSSLSMFASSRSTSVLFDKVDDDLLSSPSGSVFALFYD